MMQRLVTKLMAMSKSRMGKALYAVIATTMGLIYLAIALGIKLFPYLIAGHRKTLMVIILICEFVLLFIFSFFSSLEFKDDFEN